MLTHIGRILNRVEALAISDSEKNLLLIELSSLQKEAQRADFKLKRTLKDKSIVVNVLNATIADLEKSKLKIEQANQQLIKQQEALKQQKLLVEEQSRNLKENLEKLEFSFRELEQFSYVASHDLKSPLRTIASFAQLLKRRYTGQLDQEADEFLNYIVSGVMHMSGVIDGLLEYSKVGRNKKSFEEVDLNDVMELVKLNLRKDLEESYTQLSYPKLPSVLGNYPNLVQLFQNLIGNAIKFKKPEHPPIVNISFERQAHQWQFKLKDNGMGMEIQYKNKAFLPFQRLNNCEKPGLGIGLAICKKIIDIHKGSIDYEPSEMKGTTFVFTLPATSPESARVEPEPVLNSSPVN